MSGADGKLFVEVFVTLFVIMDPPGTIPLFLSLTSGRTPAMRRRLAGQAVLVAFFVITVFALFGQSILNYLGITLPAMQAAGGLHGRERDAEVVQDRLAEEGEHRDDEERHENRLARQSSAHGRGAAAGEAEEQGDRPRRIHDHEERHEDLDEELPVGAAHRTGALAATAVSPVAWATSASKTSGSVVCSPSRFSLPAPW